MSFPYTQLQRAWLQDLKITEELQTTAMLHEMRSGKADAYCCLGRACIVANYTPFNVSCSGNIISYGLEEDERVWESLPQSLVEELQLRNDIGSFFEEELPADVPYKSLVEMNDSGYTFKQIAEFIEAHPRAVFTNLKKSSF